MSPILLVFLLFAHVLASPQNFTEYSRRRSVAKDSPLSNQRVPVAYNQGSLISTFPVVARITTKSGVLSAGSISSSGASVQETAKFTSGLTTDLQDLLSVYRREKAKQKTVEAAADPDPYQSGFSGTKQSQVETENYAGAITGGAGKMKIKFGSYGSIDSAKLGSLQARRQGSLGHIGGHTSHQGYGNAAGSYSNVNGLSGIQGSVYGGQVGSSFESDYQQTSSFGAGQQGLVGGQQSGSGFGSYQNNGYDGLLSNTYGGSQGISGYPQSGYGGQSQANTYAGFAGQGTLNGYGSQSTASNYGSYSGSFSPNQGNVQEVHGPNINYGGASQTSIQNLQEYNSYATSFNTLPGLQPNSYQARVHYGGNQQNYQSVGPQTTYNSYVNHGAQNAATGTQQSYGSGATSGIRSEYAGAQSGQQNFMGQGDSGNDYGGSSFSNYPQSGMSSTAYNVNANGFGTIPATSGQNYVSGITPNIYPSANFNTRNQYGNSLNSGITYNGQNNGNSGTYGQPVNQWNSGAPYGEGGPSLGSDQSYGQTATSALYGEGTMGYGSQSQHYGGNQDPSDNEENYGSLDGGFGSGHNYGQDQYDNFSDGYSKKAKAKL
ncbi:hypothetical protein QR680_010185 [Steinernema hermaphroditum]|uniref:Uncharacterized protein n=1 Tax=Steinernema hermaphroditum TaxID=289476 RepID=A0AA39MBB6_9BILA|nr:hypothetical protein QR680_010185 [Steinernema hermaphroditum]